MRLVKPLPAPHEQTSGVMSLPDWLQTVMTFVGGGAGLKSAELIVGRFNRRDDLESQLRKELREENLSLKREVEKLELQLAAKTDELEQFIDKNESALRSAKAVSEENETLRERNTELMQQVSVLVRQNRSLVSQNGQLSAEGARLASDLRAMTLWIESIRERSETK